VLKYLSSAADALRIMQLTAVTNMEAAVSDCALFLNMLQRARGSKGGLPCLPDAFFATVVPLLHPGGIGVYSYKKLRAQYDLYMSQESFRRGKVVVVVRPCGAGIVTHDTFAGMCWQL
jgi:hypothetical protein